MHHHESKPLGCIISDSLTKCKRRELEQNHRINPETSPDTPLETINYVLHGGVTRKQAVSQIMTPQQFNDLLDLSKSKKEPEIILRFVVEPLDEDAEEQEGQGDGPPAKKQTSAKVDKDFAGFQLGLEHRGMAGNSGSSKIYSNGTLVFL